MKLNDAAWGGLLVLFGAGLLVHVSAFPSIPGQRVGPGLFPAILAIALAVCGCLLVARGLRLRSVSRADAPWLRLPEWAHAPRQRLGFAALVGVNLLYLLAVERLGFVLTGTVYLAALMAVLRVRPRRIVPIALVLTLAIHFCFYKLLRVPLPWGVLQRWAW